MILGIDRRFQPIVFLVVNLACLLLTAFFLFSVGALCIFTTVSQVTKKTTYERLKGAKAKVREDSLREILTE